MTGRWLHISNFVYAQVYDSDYGRVRWFFVGAVKVKP